MFKAIIVVCSIYATPKCIELHDIIRPDGYATKTRCEARLSQMVEDLMPTLIFPHTLTMSCSKDKRVQT
jgi:hypothetical protein